MKMNPSNDVYPGDLSILNIRKQQWARGEDRSRIYSIAAAAVLVIGLCCMVFVMNKLRGGTTMMSQLPLHITIWITALLAYLVTRQGKKISQAPFYGYHDARFEADDDTLYYRYQQGMTIRTYYIKDSAIRRIIRDDEWGVILIEGEGTVNIQKRGSETESSVSEFYCLVPFDKYDLDDLLEPYGRKVKKAQESLRLRYTGEH